MTEQESVAANKKNHINDEGLEKIPSGRNYGFHTAAVPITIASATHRHRSTLDG
jgi:hypothetical protein